MKFLYLFLLSVWGLSATVHAQDIDDDMYFVSSKKKAAKSAAKTAKNKTVYTDVSEIDVSEDYEDANVDYHTGQLRDVDDYNRRGNLVNNGQVVAKLVNDTLYVFSNDSTSQKTYVYGSEAESGSNYYDDDNSYYDDYVLTSRLGRYHSVHFIDPWYWDYCYGWYDPWYDPWYGWYAPYYRHGFYSWYDWGWYHRHSWSLGWGCSYPPYHHHSVYPGGGFNNGSVSYRPVYTNYRNGGLRQGSYTGRGNRNSNTSVVTRYPRNSSTDGTRQEISRRSRDNTLSRGSRVTTNSEGVNSRAERGTIRNESTTRNSSQSTRSSRETYSTPSRSSSSSMGSFGGSSSRGGFGGGFSGGRSGGGGSVGRGR